MIDPSLNCHRIVMGVPTKIDGIHRLCHRPKRSVYVVVYSCRKAMHHQIDGNRARGRCFHDSLPVEPSTEPGKVTGRFAGVKGRPAAGKLHMYRENSVSTFQGKASQHERAALGAPWRQARMIWAFVIAYL